MDWLYLLIAGLLEVVWAVALKASAGLSKPLPTTLFAVAYIASVYVLGLALNTLPLGTAYTIWAGIGVLGTTVYGIFWLEESTEVFRLICIAMVLIGIAGLKISSHPSWA